MYYFRMLRFRLFHSRFFDVFRGYEMGTLARNGLYYNSLLSPYLEPCKIFFFFFKSAAESR